MSGGGCVDGRRSERTSRLEEEEEEVKKETDGKEKESCCIIKLFIFLHGMVNTKKDAEMHL